MIHGRVELHNAEEVAPAVGGGVAMQRIPETARKRLNAHAQERMLDATCMEIRFVIERGDAAVTVRTLAGESQAHVFFGEFQTGQVERIGPEPVRIAVRKAEWFLAVERGDLGRTAFSHRVCRICLGGPRVCLLGVEGDVRPPEPGELPRLRYLAYGTSITQGAGSSSPHLCFAAQAARRMGADLINLGVGSSAFCEPELADYVASRTDWDLATIEPTANMQGFTRDEFEQRVAYWARALLAPDCARHVVLVTLMPQSADLGPAHRSRRHRATPCEYREAMRHVAYLEPHPRLHVVGGPELLPDLRGLGPDLLHPKDHGHILIGENLARAMAGFRSGVPDA
jgi:hypothetical protein